MIYTYEIATTVQLTVEQMASRAAAIFFRDGKTFLVLEHEQLHQLIRQGIEYYGRDGQPPEPDLAFTVLVDEFELWIRRNWEDITK